MEDEEEEHYAVVIDHGSSMCKVGFAGDDSPKALFPGILGRPKYHSTIHTSMGMGTRGCYFADEALSKYDTLSLSYPIERGIVTNWDDMEKLWHHILYNELNVVPGERPVLLTDPFLNPRGNREYMTQIMFETFNVPAFYVGMQAVMSMYATGRYTGVMVESGNGVTQIVPIWLGQPVMSAAIRIDLAGCDLTKYLQTLLRNERGYSFTTSYEMEIVRDIKEKFCCTAMDLLKQTDPATSSSSIEKSYKLPEGDIITFGKERFLCTEALFQPSLIGRDSPGLHQLIHQSIMACDAETRDGIYRRVILSGGTTVIPKLEDRLRAELRTLAPPSCKVGLVVPGDRRFSVWIGASIFGSQSSVNSDKLFVTRQEYDEFGPSIVHRKCF